MTAFTFWDRILSVLGSIAFFPVRVAFWIIALWAWIGNGNAEDVYLAMWSVNLDLPRIPRLATVIDDAPVEDAA